MQDETAAISSPRNAISLRSAYTKDLSNLFIKTDKLLKEQLDKLSVQFITSHTDFYNAYKSNRIIIDPGTSGTQTKEKLIPSDLISSPNDCVEILDSTCLPAGRLCRRKAFGLFYN